MEKAERLREKECQVRLDHAKGFGDVYEIVKETVKRSLGEYRVGMMLYLDDLPLQLGAYHSLGTNNIVLNRSILNIIEASIQSRQTINAFVYNILLHEYLHALGYLRETEVNQLIQKITEESFEETETSDQEEMEPGDPEEMDQGEHHKCEGIHQLLHMYIVCEPLQQLLTYHQKIPLQIWKIF